MCGAGVVRQSVECDESVCAAGVVLQSAEECDESVCAAVVAAEEGRQQRSAPVTLAPNHLVTEALQLQQLQTFIATAKGESRHSVINMNLLLIHNLSHFKIISIYLVTPEGFITHLHFLPIHHMHTLITHLYFLPIHNMHTLITQMYFLPIHHMHTLITHLYILPIDHLHTLSSLLTKK